MKKSELEYVEKAYNEWKKMKDWEKEEVNCLCVNDVLSKFCIDKMKNCTVQSLKEFVEENLLPSEEFLLKYKDKKRSLIRFEIKEKISQTNLSKHELLYILELIEKSKS